MMPHLINKLITSMQIEFEFKMSVIISENKYLKTVKNFKLLWKISLILDIYNLFPYGLFLP